MALGFRVWLKYLEVFLSTLNVNRSCFFKKEEPKCQERRPCFVIVRLHLAVTSLRLAEAETIHRQSFPENGNDWLGVLQKMMPMFFRMAWARSIIENRSIACGEGGT